MITKKELLTMDPDTEDSQLVYELTTGPMHGYLENKLQPGRAAVTFTQGKGLGGLRKIENPIPMPFFNHPNLSDSKLWLHTLK